MGQYRAEPDKRQEGVETMHPASQQNESEDIVRSARIHEGAEAGRNDRLVDVIWAAGFFDGEGCVFIMNEKNHHSLRLVVTQKYPSQLYVFQRLWGGYLHIRTVEHGKKCFCQWSLAAKKGRVALEEMLPYLRGKKDQAELAIEYQKSRSAQFNYNRSGVPASELVRRETCRLRLMEMKK